MTAKKPKSAPEVSKKKADTIPEKPAPSEENVQEVASEDPQPELQKHVFWCSEDRDLTKPHGFLLEGMLGISDGKVDMVASFSTWFEMAMEANNKSLAPKTNLTDVWGKPLTPH
jgi:hypothetical protein